MLEKIIQNNRENGLTLKDLVSMTNMTPRDIRMEVGELQKSGIPIVNFQDGSGYYITDDKDEIKRYIKQELNRGMASMKRAWALEDLLNSGDMYA